MKLAHNIKINVFVKPEDDEQKVVEKLKLLSQIKDFEKEKVKIKKTEATSFEERKIQIYEIELKRNKQINNFLANLIKKIDEHIELIKKQMQSRLDKNNNFFIRLEKDKLLENKYKITDSGNCYHIKITIAAFPKTRENAVKIIEEILGCSH